MYLPAKASGPVPVLLNLTFGFGPRGSAAAKAGRRRRRGRPNPRKRARRRSGTGGFDPMGEVLNRGWGYATLSYSEIQPDRADRWTEGVIGLTLKAGQTRPAPDEWGTISAWAWGISRAIDYLQTDPAIDARRIAITGMSRLGKTVLWAAAQDERVAAVFSVVSGEMGAALIRRDWGETLDDMAQNFPWQFAGNLQKWVGRWDELPVDQHMLIALCAPRAGIHQRRADRPVERPEGRIPGPGGGRAGVPPARGKGPGRHRAAAAGRAGDRRRPGVPLPQRRTHGGPGRLEGLPRVRRAAFPREETVITGGRQSGGARPPDPLESPRDSGGPVVQNGLSQLGRGVGGILWCVDRKDLSFRERWRHFLFCQVVKQHLAIWNFSLRESCANRRDDLSHRHDRRLSNAKHRRPRRLSRHDEVASKADWCLTASLLVALELRRC